MNTPNPFELKYTPQFAELLHNLKISLVISTYQAGKVIAISAYDKDKLIQFPRTFKNAMGMALKDEKMAIVTKDSVEVLKNASKFAPIYPKKPNTYDAIFMPRASYKTGYLALHDMAYLNKKLVAVNTLFSCLSYIDEEQSFTPFWQPPFIDKLMPEDRCHLNGLATENDEIKYLTALGTTNKTGGWREDKITGGVLMEYPSGKILTKGLSMPHSPRIYDDKLYVLNSAQGELLEINRKTGTSEVVVNLGGFARGMEKIGDYLFIGVSKLRHNSKAFKDLPIAKSSFAGVIAVHLPYKTIVGTVSYKMSVDEIYDVKILPQIIRPNILSTESEFANSTIIFDNENFWIQNKNETQKNKESVSPQNSMNIQILKNINATDINTKFNNLIYVDLKNKISEGKVSNKLNMLVAEQNNQPLGLIVFDAKNDKTATIHSVFVKKEYRRKKIAKIMLKQLQTVLHQNKIKYIEAQLSSKDKNKNIIENLFENFPEFNIVVKS